MSTDRRLRNWDFGRNDFQPIALLPNHWMAILLKFFSRSDDDYKSFVSFLRLPLKDPIIPAEELQIILAGISEITEDFENQEFILEHMVSNNIKSILSGKDIYEIQANSYTFAKETYDREFRIMKKGYESKIDSLKQAGSSEIRQKQINHKHELISELENQISSFERIKIPIDNKINKRYNIYKSIFWSSLSFYYLILLVLTIHFGWDIMEPITYFIGVCGLIGSLIYINLFGNSINLAKHFAFVKEKIISINYRKANFEINEVSQLIKRKGDLLHELEDFKEMD